MVCFPDLHLLTIDTSYYCCQIMIHRNFISPSLPPLPGFPSLAICSNAARGCSRVLEVIQQRGLAQESFGFAPFPAMASGLILLVHVFSDSETRCQPTSSAMADLQRCIAILNILGPTSCVAQRCARELERLAKIATRGQSCPSDDHDVEKPPPPVVNQPQDLRESCDIILPFTTKELSLLTFDGYPTLSPSMDAPSRAVDGVPPPVAPPPQAETSMSDSEDSNHPLFSSPLPSPILPDNFPFDSFLQWPPRNAEEGYLPWAAISSSGGDGTDGGFQWTKEWDGFEV